MVFLFLFLVLSTPLNAREFYYSDSLGNRKESSAGIESSRWILGVEIDGSGEERLLYKDGIPYKRWVISRYIEEGEPRIIEKYYYGDSLRSETTFNKNDRILEELLYDSNGELLVRKRYFYSEDGRLMQINSEGSSGESSDYRLKYRDEGSLFSLQSDNEDKIEWRSSDFNRQYLDTLYMVEGSTSSIFRYDNGKLERKMRQNGETSIEDTVYTYSDAGTIETEVTTEESNGRKIERSYDPDGLLLAERIYQDGVLSSSLTNSYSSGRLVRRQEINSFAGNVWFYEYCSTDPDETDPCLIRQYRNGDLLKVTEYLEEKTIETLYRNNEAVMTKETERNTEEEVEPDS